VTQTPLVPLSARSAGTGAVGSPATERTSVVPRTPHTGRAREPRSRLQAYIALTKPRIIELLLVTTLPSMVLAARGLPDWWVVVVTMLGGTLAAGSANCLNCYLDRDIDAVMRRTTRRPLARHEVSPTGALVFGLVLGLVSVAAIGFVTNWLAGALTFVAIGYYVLIYTMLLKRHTSQNIVWGGVAGCMPVFIGWSAVTGSLAWAPVALFLVVFFWTPPHTWALATRYKDDYARAGVPMLPVVASPMRVARDIVIYTWATVAASLALWPLDATWVYGVLAAAAGAVLIAGAHKLYLHTRADSAHDADGSGPRAKPMLFFHLSNSYLAFVFVAVAVDAFVR
jgi:protoheme IX farnesyltransferase